MPEGFGNGPLSNRSILFSSRGGPRPSHNGSAKDNLLYNSNNNYLRELISNLWGDDACKGQDDDHSSANSTYKEPLIF